MPEPEYIEEDAHLPPYYGELTVPVLAPRYYYGERIKPDEYSHKIVLSKKSDMSDYFYAKVKAVFDNCQWKDSVDLICVVPSSKVGSFSPTLLSIAERLSKETGVPNDNIITRIKTPERKMTDLSTQEERHNAIKGTLPLNRQLSDKENRVLLLDDTKVSGCTILECAKLLNMAGALGTFCICLGINKTTP